MWYPEVQGSKRIDHGVEVGLEVALLEVLVGTDRIFFPHGFAEGAILPCLGTVRGTGARGRTVSCRSRGVAARVDRG